MYQTINNFLYQNQWIMALFFGLLVAGILWYFFTSLKKENEEQ